jgi:iron only hydrogenase large subunit-like protein
LAETININKPPPTSIVGLHKSIDVASIGIEKKSKSATPIKVSLNDCLACNGCVTTAEAILIEQQSADQFLAGLRLRPTLSVVTVSPQSIASIAVRRRMSLSAAARAITAFLHKSGT